MKFWIPTYAVLFAGFLLALVAWEQLPDGKMHLHFFDVGQGDAALIETSAGHRILVDGGPDETLLEMIGDVVPFHDRRIDIVVLSHPERDHVTALPMILERYDVSHVLLSGVVRESYLSWYDALLDAIIRSGAHPIFASAESDIDLGDGMLLDVLWPRESIVGKEEDQLNSTSVVFKLVGDGGSVLFSGDIGKEVEGELLKMGCDLTADILKVPHHGSKSSSSTGFLLSVNPRLAVISVGKNSYGHPHASVLQRYENFGIKIRRTDEEGTIELVLD